MQHTVKSFAGDETYTEGKGVRLPNVDDLVARGEAELLEWDLEPGKSNDFSTLTASKILYFKLQN